MEQMCSQPSWSLEETESPAGEQQDNVQHIQAVMDEMQLRKQRFLLFLFHLEATGCFFKHDTDVLLIIIIIVISFTV